MWQTNVLYVAIDTALHYGASKTACLVNISYTAASSTVVYMLQRFSGISDWWYSGDNQWNSRELNFEWLQDVDQTDNAETWHKMTSCLMVVVIFILFYFCKEYSVCVQSDTCIAI